MPQEPSPSRATWLPFALCLLLTAAATALVAHAEREAEKARVKSDAGAVSRRISERMASYAGVLRATSAFLSRPEPVATEEFGAFVTRLKLREVYPGTQGLGYLARFGVMSAEEASTRAHADGWAEVQVWPTTPREEVHAVVLIEPPDERNRALLGFDMNVEPLRREAMERARDAGDVVLSRSVALVQPRDGERRTGLVLYSPVYTGDAIPASVGERRAQIKGYAFAVLTTGDLFAGVFGDEPPAVAFDLYEGEGTDPYSRLHTFGRSIEPTEDTVIERLPVAGRIWTARFVPAVPGGDRLSLALVVAVLGAFLSVVVLLVMRAQRQAQASEVKATAAALASQEIVRYNDMFIGILGHDLRTPLHAIMLSTELLRRQACERCHLSGAIERIRASTLRMTRMIEQILDLTRARVGGGIGLMCGPADLGPLVRDVIDELARSVPEAHVELMTCGDLRGEWDADRLAQAFSNLIENAVRHREKSPVHVTIDGSDPERVIARIENAGVIAPRMLPMVFEPFRGAPRPHGSAAGLGLGLYITRAIIDAHGGSVTVASGDEIGTTFTVSLPRAVRPGAAPPTDPQGR
ncbi:MAG TPA: CHASE domain-containing protein [Nannocystis sp.]